jgi:AraC-like DNA-binding protein
MPMNASFPRSSANLPVDPSILAAELRADAARAIAALGVHAKKIVPVASLAHYGGRIGWPEWLFTGSSFEGRSGPPPALMAASDDLMISANLFAHVGAVSLVTQSISMAQPAAGSIGRLALANAPNFGAIFSFLRRAMLLSGPQCLPAIDEKPGHLAISLVGTVPLGRLLDYTGLLYVALHYRAIEELILAENGNASINLTMPDGPESAAIRQLFRCEVRFGMPVNLLRTPTDWADRPNVGHDPQLWALAMEKLRAAEAQFVDGETIHRLRQRIARLLTENRQAPRLKQVAQAEGMSTRSLVRHIAAGGYSFHGLVDYERRLRAARLINDPGVSIRDIAEELGFPDVSSFGRKFRNWFGDSPARFRRGRP